MGDDDWKIKYEQLNQRARWYSTQLWVVPFTYLGLMGVAFEKINSLQETYFKTAAFLLIAFFSLAVFVHVSSVKYYERRAVAAMKRMEPSALSSGGSCWYLDYTFFIRALICALSFLFTFIGIWTTVHEPCARLGLLVPALLVLVVLYLVIIVNDYRRNEPIKAQIRETPQ